MSSHGGLKLNYSPGVPTRKGPSLDGVRQQTSEAVKAAFRANQPVLLEAPVASGKTTATFDAAAETGEPLTYLTLRRDLYEQAKSLSKERGLEAKIIPSPQRDCPSFDGETDEKLADELDRLYRRGVSGWKLHDELELPCQPGCPYMEKRDFDRDQYDVLIGYPKQAYAEKNVEGRVVVLDEFAGSAFEVEIEETASVVSRFLDRHPGLPFGDRDDILEGRGDQERVEEALAWFIENGIGPDADEVLDTDGRGHSLAPYISYALLQMRDLGNGWEVHPFPEPWPEFGVESKRYCVRNRTEDTFSVLTPPDLSSANGVVGLDATPTKALWELAYDVDFDRWELLDSDERNEYIQNALGVTIKQDVSGAVRHGGGGNVSPNRAASFLFGIEVEEGQQPAVVGAQKALDVYEEEGVLGHAKRDMNFAEVLSSNDYEEERVLAITDSPHPGNPDFQKWGAHMGEAVEQEGEGTEKDFGPVGNDIYRHFVQNKVHQALLRAGRDGGGATAYCFTAATPAWLDTEPVEFVKFTSPAKREVVQHLRRRGDGGAGKSGIVEATGYSERTVRECLYELRDGGHVEKQDCPGPYPDEWRWQP